MTAEKNASVMQGVLGALRTLRDQWLLLAFMAGALFWLRDTYDEFAPLPATVAAQTVKLAALTQGVARLEQTLDRQDERRFAPAVSLGAHGNVVEDGRAGEWITARLKRVVPLRTDCRADALNAWLIDQAGRWFSAPTSLDRLPELRGETELGFGVRIGTEAVPGRASLLVQFTHDCGTHRQVLTATSLPLLVIEG